MRTSKWGWWYQQQFRTKEKNDHCQLPTHCLSDCGNESGLCSPTSIHFNPHLHPNLTSLVTSAPRPLEQNNPRDHFKAPPRTMSSFCIYCSADRGESAEGWQLFEGVEGRGVWRGQCHTKGGQEGKISHPWSVRQRTLFGREGGSTLEPWTNKYLTQAEGSPKSPHSSPLWGSSHTHTHVCMYTLF